MQVSEEDMSYLIGKEGSTQSKIEKAAGCVLIYVGNFAHIAGTYNERKRCRDYLGWLLKQLKGAVTVRDVASRDDCLEMYVPQNCKGWIMGNRGSELRRVEKETGVFSFMALDDRGEERLLILGHDAGTKSSKEGRLAAERMVNEMIQDKRRGDRGRSNSRHGNRGRSDSRPRKRSPPPRARSDSRPRRPPPRRDDSRDRKPPPRRKDSRSPPRRNAS